MNQSEATIYLEMSNEHAKLSAPISNVIDPENIVTKKLQQSTDSVSDDGGPEVTHVHLLGDVW